MKAIQKNVFLKENEDRRREKRKNEWRNVDFIENLHVTTKMVKSEDYVR